MRFTHTTVPTKLFSGFLVNILLLPCYMIFPPAPMKKLTLKKSDIMSFPAYMKKFWYINIFSSVNFFDKIKVLSLIRFLYIFFVLKFSVTGKMCVQKIIFSNLYTIFCMYYYSAGVCPRGHSFKAESRPGRGPKFAEKGRPLGRGPAGVPIFVVAIFFCFLFFSKIIFRSEIEIFFKFTQGQTKFSTLYNSLIGHSFISDKTSKKRKNFIFCLNSVKV